MDMEAVKEILTRSTYQKKDSEEAESKATHSIHDELRQLEYMETPQLINCDTVPSGRIYKVDNRGGITFIYARLKDGRWYEGIVNTDSSINYDSEFSFSKIPTTYKGKSLKDFKVDVYATSNLDAANTTLRFASNYVKKFESDFHKDGMGLYFFSENTGCGKSLIASIIGNELIARGVNVRFIKAINFFEKLKAEINSNADSYHRSNTLHEIQNVDVLIFDDLGAENAKEYERKKFYQLIDSRYNTKKVTIFTSRKPFSRLTYDESTLDLIKQRTIPVTLPKESVGDKLINQRNRSYQQLLNE